MRKYSITLEHDNGVIAIETSASHIIQAITQVLEYEAAPNRAVLSAIDITDEKE